MGKKEKPKRLVIVKFSVHRVFPLKLSGGHTERHTLQLEESMKTSGNKNKDKSRTVADEQKSKKAGGQGGRRSILRWWRCLGSAERACAEREAEEEGRRMPIGHGPCETDAEEWTLCAACSGLCGVMGFSIRRRASVENKILEEKKKVLSSENLSSAVYLL